MRNWRSDFRLKHTFDYILEPDRKVAEDIISRFKKRNPELMELEPEIGINQFTQDAYGNQCVFFMVLVGHQFIFDYRLIPIHFEDIEVKSYLCEEMPKEFPTVNEDTQIEVYHSPNNYILFVERNIVQIRKKLKSSTMSIDEALDALTGDFEQHKKWVTQLNNERTLKNN